MNTRIPIPHFPPLLFCFTLAVASLTGCDRQQTVPANAPPPPATTVGTEIDDTVVTTKVKAALLQDQDVKGLNIQVETRKGQVQLSGFVDNQAQIDRAISTTRGIEGVKQVENAMNLKDGKVSVGNKVDDSIITTRVKSALVADPGVKGFDIAVATNKGEVQLSGYVDNQQQIDHAVDVVRSVEGVQHVVNEMTLKK